jgi:preprotein translocase subunit SecB
MNKAAFSLKEYMFDKVKIDFSNKTSNELDIVFNPSGVFKADESAFELKFIFNAHNGNVENSFVEIECIANFKFEEKVTFEEIPSYFFRNSIAILFPYVRAFISTVTLQANIPPIVLPTMNLSELEKPLKENTSQEE